MYCVYYSNIPNPLSSPPSTLMADRRLCLPVFFWHSCTDSERWRKRQACYIRCSATTTPPDPSALRGANLTVQSQLSTSTILLTYTRREGRLCPSALAPRQARYLSQPDRHGGGSSFHFCSMQRVIKALAGGILSH